MPESPEEKEKRELRELEGKNIAHYSVLLTSWIETRMERDKTLVTLSAGAIALLVTILTTVGARYWWLLLFYVAAFGGFLCTIWSSIVVYQLNSKEIEIEIQGSRGERPNLKKYDQRSLVGFILGAIFSISIAIVTATSTFIEKEELTVTNTSKPQSRGQVGTGKKSLEGISVLRPQAPASQGSGSQDGGQSTPDGSAAAQGDQQTTDGKK